VVNTQFRWAPWINATCFLFHKGREAYFELHGEIVQWAQCYENRVDQIRALIRLGFEWTGWGDRDPWFYLEPVVTSASV